MLLTCEGRSENYNGVVCLRVMEFAYPFRQTGRMSTESPAERLGRFVRERRAELDLTQLEVAGQGGPSNSKLTEIENSRLASLQRQTARKLDAGLKWEPGSARRTWNGGEPTPLVHPDVDADQRRELLALVEQFSA